MPYKILVIPSLYPYLTNPNQGIFIKEQAELIATKHEVIVHQFKLCPQHWITWLIWSIIKRNRPQATNSNPYSTYITNTYTLNKKSLPLPEELVEKLNFAIIKKRVKKASEIHNGIHIIHAHISNYSGIIANLLSQQFNCPYIITEHQALQNAFHPVRNRLITKSILNANAILAVSEHLNRLLALQHLKYHATVTGNLINENIFQLSTDSDGSILFITYPDEIKGNSTFFKAIAELKKQNEHAINVQMVVTGDKNKELFKQAKELNIDNLISFHYQLERNKLTALMKQSKLLISTSVAETFGLAVGEALMCGKPVVVTASGGIDETVTPKNGIKVPVGDYKAVANGILKVLSGEFNPDPEVIRESVLHKFGREAFLEKTEQVYREVLQQHDNC